MLTLLLSAQQAEYPLKSRQTQLSKHFRMKLKNKTCRHFSNTEVFALLNQIDPTSRNGGVVEHADFTTKG